MDDRPESKPRLSGSLEIETVPGSQAGRIYGRSLVKESFNCNYELNPEYRGILEFSGMKVGGISRDGGVRIIELLDHTFYLATGFLPQIMSRPERPHPLVVAFLTAAMAAKA